MRYVSGYLRILAYRATIERVMGYKFSDDNWRELHGWGPYVWARNILLYQLMWERSEKRLIAELPSLMDEGNSLMPGLYENPAAIAGESQERLKEVIREGKSAYNPQLPGERSAF